MKTAVIRSSWLTGYGYRLDCSPYLGGALETKIILERLPLRKDKLHTLTVGFDGGIYNGPQFIRNYVESPEQGVPFMTGSSLQLADISNLPLLSTRDAYGPKLRHLELQPGMSLISCSGTIGKMAYARRGMVGIWSSQDVLKVVADPSRIPPGYLYAYLRSKFGVPLVVSGTYGSIIKHLEPEHIAELPVLRLGGILEQKIHELVELAGQSLTTFDNLLCDATKRVLAEAGINDIPRHKWVDDSARLGWSQTKIRPETLRALNYDCRIAGHVQKLRDGKHHQLGELCEPEHFNGQTVFTRIDADEKFGVKLVGQREAFRVWPEGRIIAHSSIEGLGLLVRPGTTLIPSHGTFGEFELYCRAVYVTKRTSAYAFSGDFYRCVPRPGVIPPGYLFAFMRSEVAFRMLRSISAGGKQQYQHPALMYELPIPRLDNIKELEIAKLIDSAAAEFDHALDCEEQARQLVEQTIESYS